MKKKILLGLTVLILMAVGALNLLALTGDYPTRGGGVFVVAPIF
jgi:hypothetical protein